LRRWKREAIEKLAQVFDEKGSTREHNRDAELTKLHAKIGQLVVERDFCRKPSIAEPGSEEDNDRSRPCTALDRAPVRTGVDQSLVMLL
jgi:hypothetical protein